MELLVLISAPIVVLVTVVSLLLWLSKLERDARKTWLEFRPSLGVELQPGTHRLWVDAPRRFVGPLLDPDIAEVRVLDPSSGSVIRSSGMNVLSFIKLLSRRRYIRASFRIEHAGRYEIALTLGRNRQPGELLLKLKS